MKRPKFGAGVLTKMFALVLILGFSTRVQGGDFSMKGLLFPQVVREFYEARKFEPVWNDPQMLEQLHEAIAGAFLHGLEPGDYHYAELANGSDALRTDAFIAYAHDLRYGRASHRLKGRDWKVAHKDSDLIPVLESAISTHEIRKQLESLAPSFESYGKLQKELSLYRELAANDEWPVFENPVDLETSPPDEVNQLRKRLELTKDLTEGVNLFDAVVHFQSRQGLNADGVVGKRTIAALNVGPAQRVLQIKLNLERLRWLPRELPSRFVIVNVPAFELRVYDGNKLNDTMRVVVGKNNWFTPTFINSAINRVILNPYWYVPAAIANQDIYPRLKKEPDYLQKNGIQLVPDAKGDLRLRQSPGNLNSLGRIKFLFPNCCDVYLHDTPEKHLFDQVLRSFSHGCIRVEDAFGLADWILEDQGWTEDRLRDAINSDKTQTIVLSEPVRIYIVYFTAWVDLDGSMQFRSDVYLKDKKLAQVLGIH
jgi:murein L,D-transpeptidase YcbB/YkuD